MDGSLDLHDCQCPACKKADLGHSPAIIPDRDAIQPEAISCSNCSATYDLVWGIPFLGAYEEEDFLTLVEVIANAGKNGSAPGTDPEGRRRLANLHQRLRDYHRCTNRSSFEIEPGLRAANTPWWSNRYHEFLVAHALLADIELKGLRVLDVGAGTGFNSFPLVEAGALVTLFEVNLDLVRTAQALLPEVRSVGGCGRVLPFQNASFDIVIANAALHHVRDLPTVITEMLRVLRPGGLLLTMGDPFRPDAAGEEYELSIFRDHRDVLLGINEGIPRLVDFLRPLVPYRAKLDIQLLTGPAFGVRTHLGVCDLPDQRFWTFEEAHQLAKGGGSISLAVRSHAPVEPPQPALRPAMIRPAALAAALANPAVAAVPLSRCVPAHFVDLPLLGNEHPKFRLLNGWKAQVPGVSFREAYGRVRSFLRRRPEHAFLNVELLMPHREDTDQTLVAVRVDGTEYLRRSLTRGLWHRLSVPAAAFPEGAPVNAEVHLEAEGDAGCFFVRRLEWSDQAIDGPPDRNDLDQFGLPALAEVGVLGDHSTSVLLGTDYALSIDVLNRLRGLGFQMEATVSHNQEALFLGEPDVRVVGCYPDPQVKAGRIPPLVRPIRLAVSTSAETAADLPACRSSGDIYLVTFGGHARVLRGSHERRWANTIRRVLWRNWKNRIRPRIRRLMRCVAGLLSPTAFNIFSKAPSHTR
jgi:SAM-dependent methyltransferase